jgi:hypothetical protein
MTRYQIIEHTTGRIMGVYRDHKRARRAADALDLKYGKINYYIKPIASA